VAEPLPASISYDLSEEYRTLASPSSTKSQSDPVRVQIDSCVVQFVFGIMLINILAITNALVAMFVA
jgi:hypothetical protein